MVAAYLSSSQAKYANLYIIYSQLLYIVLSFTKLLYIVFQFFHFFRSAEDYAGVYSFGPSSISAVELLSERMFLPKTTWGRHPLRP